MNIFPYGNSSRKVNYSDIHNDNGTIYGFNLSDIRLCSQSSDAEHLAMSTRSIIWSRQTFVYMPPLSFSRRMGAGWLMYRLSSRVGELGSPWRAAISWVDDDGLRGVLTCSVVIIELTAALPDDSWPGLAASWSFLSAGMTYRYWGGSWLALRTEVDVPFPVLPMRSLDTSVCSACRCCPVDDRVNNKVGNGGQGYTYKLAFPRGLKSYGYDPGHGIGATKTRRGPP